jgi:hypothetical protein
MDVTMYYYRLCILYYMKTMSFGLFWIYQAG